MPHSAPVDPARQAAFRKLMGRFATGVCVVSILREGGAGMSGITVNSFVSVSLDPMLVCWNLQNASSQFADYVGAERFAISILAEQQQTLARRYAARGDSALVVEDFVPTASGLPVIAGALGHVECRRWSVHPAGDHTMILGQVEALVEGADQAPLAFFGGRFRGLAD